ncbi:MAG: SDR family NAD(P)-dependent oxidoreductase [Rhodomicrobiaceae bacterium]
MAALNGKVALVTGGSRGIGAAIARRLAKEGAIVAITYAQSGDKARGVIADIETAGGLGLALQADNRDAGAVEGAVGETVSAFGRLDILVNNAGIFDVGPIADLDAETFDRTIAINVRAPFLASRAAASRMSDGGRIISIGSNLAQRVPWPEISLYALSKAALVGFTKGLARDLGERDITANVVHPGSTNTDMNPENGDSADLQRATMAIQRYSAPDEVAGLVAWLAGPEARSVTGAEFTIDNGSNA